MLISWLQANGVFYFLVVFMYIELQIMMLFITCLLPPVGLFVRREMYTVLFGDILPW